MDTNPRERRLPPELLIGAAWLATRLPLLPACLENHDAVNFALGLDDFDLSVQQPHFPGYPVFIAAARIFLTLGAPSAVALALPAVAVGLAATIALFRTLGRTHAATGWLAAGLYLTAPGLWLADLTATSDGLGLHVFTLCACALVAGGRTWRRVYLTAAGFGLLVGVRASCFPLAIGGGLLLLARRPGAAVAGALTGGLAWLVPLTIAAGGPGELLELGLTFSHGHFTVWGGTALVSPSLLPRAALLGQGIVDVLGWVLPALLVLVAVRLVARSDRPTAPAKQPLGLLVLAAPYAIWIALGQNAAHARHLLPFIPLAIIAAAPTVANLRLRAEHALAATAVAMLLGLPGAVEHATVLPPTLQAVEWVAQNEPPEGLQLYAGSEARLFQHYAPAFRATRVTGGADITRRVSLGTAAPRILVTSNAGDLSSLSKRLARVALFRRGTSEVALYSLDSEATLP